MSYTAIKQVVISVLALSTFFVVSAHRIAVLSDVHVTPGNLNEIKFRQAVDEISAADYDFVVLDGDLSNEGSDIELINVKLIMDRIEAPCFVIPGNHENNWSQSATRTFSDLWGSDRFVAEFDSLIIVGINCGPYMKMGDGHIKQEDLHWLDSTLARKCVERKLVLSFNHYPLLADIDNYTDYLAVLEKFPVIAHVNGHYHRWRSYIPGGEGSGSNLPAVMVRALDMGNGDYGYTELEIDSDSIHVYDKPLGKERRPMFAFPVSSTHGKASIPGRSPLVVPDGFEVTKLWADSASIFTRLGFDADKVFFGNSLGHARAIAKTDGTLLWSYPTGASLFSRPIALKDAKVAVPAADGIYILDAKKGRRKKFYPAELGPYVADGVISSDGMEYFQGAYKRFERRSPSGGKLEWTYDSISNYCQAAPAIDGTDVVFGAWDTKLRCLDSATGRLKWEWNNGKTANMLGPGNVVPVIGKDKVFIVAPDRYMTALGRNTGRQLWRDNSHRYRESLGVSEDGSRVYAKTMDGELVAVDALSPEFRELWLTDMGIGYDHAPCIVVEKDGYVYAGSRRGILSIVAADGSGLVGSLALGSSEINGIDVDPTTGDIYVSLIEGAIFRIRRL